jgi:hypothetical protein
VEGLKALPPLKRLSKKQQMGESLSSRRENIFHATVHRSLSTFFLGSRKKSVAFTEIAEIILNEEYLTH